MSKHLLGRTILIPLLVLGLSWNTYAQTFPFTSGPIPPCDTSYFTANVIGVGNLASPWTPWSSTLWSLIINITSNHPQTLQITLTSPQGTSLLLSQFNGAGGQNYTNCSFDYYATASITTGTAPFTGSWMPEGGPLGLFNGEWGDGTWTIAIVDTACANGGTGPGGTWTPGWFDGSGGGGGFAFGFNSGPICGGWIPDDQAYICPGDSVDILGYYNGMGTGYAFTIYDPLWMVITNPSAVTVPGSYSIEAYDPFDGCWYFAIFDVYFTAGAALGPDQVVDHCASSGPIDLTALFVLNGATPDWSFNGSPIATATAAAASTTGSYQLISQSPGGACNDTVLVSLNITPGPVLGADQAINICPGASLDLTTLYATSGLTTSWDFGGSAFSTPTAAVNSGVYTLIASSGVGCADTAEVTLSVQPLALGVDQVHDVCSNTSIDLTSLYTTTGLVAAWTISGSTVLNPVSVNASGTYQLVASNMAGCADSALVTLNMLTSPSLGPDIAIDACIGTVIDLTTLYSTAGLTATWTSAGTPVATPTMVSSSGTYTLLAANAVGCNDTANVMLVVSPNPNLGPDQTIIECDGVSIDLTSMYSIGVNTAAWTINGSAVTDPTFVTTSGNYMIVASNAAGCSSTAMVTVNLDPSPTLGADQLVAMCAGDEFDLSALYTTAGLTAAWTLGGASVPDPSAVTNGGNYSLVVINGFGCSDTAFVGLAVNPAPTLGPDLSFSLCPWQSIDLSAVFPVSGLNVTYILDSMAVLDPTAVQDSGTYVVTVTNSNGCIDEATALITPMECLCEAEVVHDAKCVQDPVQFTLLADSVILSAQWDFAGAADVTENIDPLVQFSGEEVMVTLQATLSCGVVTIQQLIHVPDCSDSCSVWIPSAFTPDKDGINDTWACSSECSAEDFTLMVYDRLGELVFESNDALSAWDGTIGSNLASSGVYAYRVGYRLPYQGKKWVTGSVVLLR